MNLHNSTPAIVCFALLVASLMGCTQCKPTPQTPAPHAAPHFVPERGGPIPSLEARCQEASLIVRAEAVKLVSVSPSPTSVRASVQIVIEVSWSRGEVSCSRQDKIQPRKKAWYTLQ